MRIKYKRIKMYAPHCGECKEQLFGDGSLLLPYRYRCGTWKNSWKTPMDYTLVK